MSDVKKDDQRIKAFYLLPNFLTLFGLFVSFYAIVSAVSGHYYQSAIALLVSVVMDGLDGRVARMINAETSFGAQLDSLVDMISFGLAPSLLLYELSLRQFGKVGWGVAFLYVACTALRLARFNTQLSHPDKHFFQGLNTTLSAACVAALVWSAMCYQVQIAQMPYLVIILTVFLSLLKVSNISYHSFKHIDMRNRVPFFALFILVLLFVMIALEPPFMVMLIAVSYVLSGPVMAILKLPLFRRKKH